MNDVFWYDVSLSCGHVQPTCQRESPRYGELLYCSNCGHPRAAVKMISGARVSACRPGALTGEGFAFFRWCALRSMYAYEARAGWSYPPSRDLWCWRNP